MGPPSRAAAGVRLGARVAPGGARFRVWAPRARRVEVELYLPAGPVVRPLRRQARGYWGGLVAEAGAGCRYRYRLDGQAAFPDPASRAQPDGVHGPSEIVDPARFAWRDQAWRGLDRDRLVLYELHVGTFSAAGTFDGVVEELPRLAELGVTAIELMPVAAFPGRWNWGYDGVDLFAPAAVYGGPEGLRRLVDAAHRQGLGVVLDVVYNHFGPAGNYLRAYAEAYFTDRHRTPWGEAIDYDGPASAEVRAFVLANVRHWLDEYHVDGLRLDATHAIFDAGPRHLLAEIAEVAHRRRRPALVIAEDHRNERRLIDRPARGGFGLDGVWADDFHHALRTYLLGEFEGYFRHYSGRLSDVARAIEGGFLHQGQTRREDGGPRGTPTGNLPARAFVFCIENHDQVGNRARGERLDHLIDRSRYLLASAALLLSPETPLIFQGQEVASRAPFQYFTDHEPELGRLVTAGRRDEFKHFAAFSDPARRSGIPDPQDPATFERSRLVATDRATNAEVETLYRTLLHLRRSDPVLSRPDRTRTLARAVGVDALVIYRWRGRERRLAVLNFSEQAVEVDPADLAGPAQRAWQPLWSVGHSPSTLGHRWQIPARSGVLLATPAAAQRVRR